MTMLENCTKTRPGVCDTWGAKSLALSLLCEYFVSRHIRHGIVEMYAKELRLGDSRDDAIGGHPRLPHDDDEI